MPTETGERTDVSVHGAGGDEAVDASGSTMAGDPFAPRSGGIAKAIARFFGRRVPFFAALAVWIIAFVVLGAFIVGLGLLLTHVLLGAGLGSIDGEWSRWFVAERTPELNATTRIGSDVGSTGVILAVAAVSGIALVVGKYWRQFWFLFIAMTLEFSLFLIATMIIDRHRPNVVQLDSAPPTSSFPSGHTASSLTMYVGLAIVLGSLIPQKLARTVVWALAILLPVFVALSRLYRGMHFPTDVAASVALACGALLFALLAVRSMTAASNEHDTRAAIEPVDSPPAVKS
jgi:membrane-associated phospholipid phosphatase